MFILNCVLLGVSLIMIILTIVLAAQTYEYTYIPPILLACGLTLIVCVAFGMVGLWFVVSLYHVFKIIYGFHFDFHHFLYFVIIFIFFDCLALIHIHLE